MLDVPRGRSAVQLPRRRLTERSSADKMNIIELERWVPTEENPRKLKYAGQPAAQEVFEELKHRLEGMGYLPDEYFLMDDEWGNGREIPKGADIFCTTDYGGSEGVYLDVYLKWHEDGKPVTRSFITGKTLGESGDDLDRMFLISSAITKAFHGGEATHARYMKVGGVEEDAGGSVVHLSREEQRTIIGALAEQRERQENAMSQTEQLLRRMTGSITRYMDTVGQRPLQIDAYDRAVLAIRDGELSAFKDLYPRLLKDHADELLIEAAGRPGDVGRKMSALLLADAERFSEPAYRAACQKAVDIADREKVLFLLEQAEAHAECLVPSFHGEMAHYAYQDHKWIAADIVAKLTQEQFKAAPYFLLTDAVINSDYATASKLAQRGFNADACFAEIVRHCCTHNDKWQPAHLLEMGLHISADSFDSLHACVEFGCLDAGQILLDQGMDLGEYEEWAKVQNHGLRVNDTLGSLREHWQELQMQVKNRRIRRWEG